MAAATAEAVVTGGVGEDPEFGIPPVGEYGTGEPFGDRCRDSLVKQTSRYMYKKYLSFKSFKRS
jgi:hypothetical protein